MRFAICSDLHHNAAALERVLADAHDHQADRLIFLGDAGFDEDLLARLQQHTAVCIFGNWEVSGLRRMPSAQRAWVAAWPATLACDDVIFCHATPDMPAQVTSTQGAVKYMRNGIGWMDLFPRLHSNEEARWRALAVLEEKNCRVAFHGHTHIQEVWAWNGSAPARHWRSFSGPVEFQLEAGLSETPNRYLVGVGSAGQPQDGPRLRYVLFDSATNSVDLRALA